MKKKILGIAGICICCFVCCAQENNPDTSNLTPAAEPTITQAVNEADIPDVTTIPEYFKPLLGEAEGVDGYIKKNNGLVKVQNATVEEAQELSYCSVEESQENGYVFSMQWIKISKELILEDIAVDLSSYYKNGQGWAPDGVFYDETSKKIFIKFDALAPDLIQANDPVLLLVEVPIENPAEYKITEFDDPELKEYPLWFSDASCIGTTIYDNQGNSTVMWTIDMQTKELQSLEYVQNKAEEIATQILREKELGENYYVSYSVRYQQKDATVYNAVVHRDIEECFFTLYLAFDGQEYLGAMVEDYQTGELQMWNGNAAK